MRLTPEEEAMLAGGRGEAVRDALRYQLEVGEFFGAERFVAITNAHMMGDIEVMGDGGLDWLRARRGQRACVPITTNARCIDFEHAARLGQDAAEVVKERELIACLRDMDVLTTDTCVNYQTLYQPHLGEHVAWGDTGTVIYANSVFGARTNFESGPAALAAAITGRTPEYGFHLDRHRKGTLIVRLEAPLDDLADWGAVGKIVGEKHQNYYAVPVFTGPGGKEGVPRSLSGRTPTADELKHLGAALASYGSMGMFHMVGVTPEAPTIEAALGGNRPVDEIVVDAAALERVYAGYDRGDGTATLVVFSGPQLSLFELKALVAAFGGRKVHPGTQVFVTTSNSAKSAARGLGYLQALEDAGVTVLEGVCFYILQNLTRMRIANGWTNMVSNSAKIVNIIGAHRFNTILRPTRECVEIACSGRLEPPGSPGYRRDSPPPLTGGLEPPAPPGVRRSSPPPLTGGLATIRVARAFGPVVEGEAVVSAEGFSPRYDLDRWTGLISKPGHSLEGTSVRDRILFFPTAKGGIAAGWAFYDIKHKGIAPKAFVFGVTNPVMVQGAVFAGIPITEGWDRPPEGAVRTGDWVRVDPARRVIEVLRRAG